MLESVSRDSELANKKTEQLCTVATLCLDVQQANASNKPPRGELRDSPNNDQRTCVRIFLRIKFCHLVFALGQWTSI